MTSEIKFDIFKTRARLNINEVFKIQYYEWK